MEMPMTSPPHTHPANRNLTEQLWLREPVLSLHKGVGELEGAEREEEGRQPQVPYPMPSMPAPGLSWNRLEHGHVFSSALNVNTALPLQGLAKQRQLPASPVVAS